MEVKEEEKEDCLYGSGGGREMMNISLQLSLRDNSYFYTQEEKCKKSSLLGKCRLP